ncbi:hypothetical protein [Nocardioides dilutus]
MTVGRWWHLLGVGVVGLVLLGLGTMLDGWLPDEMDDPGSRPFVRAAEMAERVDLRTMAVEVDAVRVARTLVEYGTEQHSPGVWVLVEYTVVPERENTALGFAELSDAAGRVWSLGGRNDNVCPAGPPGVPVGCVAFFEVPPDALGSLRLRLARERFEQRYDVVAEVDLGLTAEDADRASGAPALEVPAPTIGGRP